MSRDVTERRPDVDLIATRISLYRTVVALATTLPAGTAVLNLISGDPGLALRAGLVTAALVAALVRSFQGPQAVRRDAIWVGLLPFGALALAAVTGVTVATPFALIGIVMAALLLPTRMARLAMTGHVVFVVTIALTAPPDGVLTTLAVAAFALATTIDPVATGLRRLSDELDDVNKTLASENEALREEARRRERSIVEAQDAVLMGVGSLLDGGADDGLDAPDRVAGPMRVLANAYRDRYGDDLGLSETWADDLVRSSVMHDVGKVGVPRDILDKPGPLDDVEAAHMREHCRIGRDVVDEVIATVGTDDGLFTVTRDVVYAHHERWDGAGYPEGLAGDAIPLAGRLMAVIDVYDALTDVRPYKGAWTEDRAFETIAEGRGTRFDPVVVDLFLSLREPVVAAAGRAEASDAGAQDTGASNRS